jgi:hypothetical protein
MNFIYKNEGLAPMAVEKIKMQGAVLELPAKQHCQFSPFVEFHALIPMKPFFIKIPNFCAWADNLGR